MAQDKLQGKQRGQGRPQTQTQTQTQTKSVPQKRQVRRRLHTTRPYQERLLNMAEARKEIVTALKFHRASMKQQQQHHQIESTVYEKQQTPPPPPPISPTSPPSSTNHCFYPNSTPLSTITLNNMSILPDQTLGLNLNFQGFTDMDASTLYTHTIDSSSILQPCFSPSSLSHLSPPLSSSSPPPDSTYNSLPFFNTCRHHHHHQMQQTSITHDPTTENSDQQLSHLTHLWLEGENSDQQLSHLTHLWLDGENSDHLSHLTHLQLDGENSDHISQSTHLELDGEMINNNSNNFGFHSSLHPRGLDNEQMEEIRTIGKRHQIEWNDTLSLVNSAWWSKFLNTMESGSGLLKVGDDGFGQEVMESNTYGWPALYYPPGIHNQTFHANHDDLPCMDTQDEEYWLS